MFANSSMAPSRSAALDCLQCQLQLALTLAHLFRAHWKITEAGSDPKTGEATRAFTLARVDDGVQLTHGRVERGVALARVPVFLHFILVDELKALRRLAPGQRAHERDLHRKA